MRIQNQPAQLNHLNAQSEVKAKTTSQADAKGGCHDDIKVSVSSKAKELASASFDDAKVARLKSAIDNGSYEVDAHAIAAKIVDEGAT